MIIWSAPCSDVPRGTLNEWAAWAKFRCGQSHVGIWSDPCLRSRPARLFHVEHWTRLRRRADKISLVKVASALGTDHLASSGRPEPCSDVPRGTLDLPAKSR